MKKIGLTISSLPNKSHRAATATILCGRLIEIQEEAEGGWGNSNTNLLLLVKPDSPYSASCNDPRPSLAGSSSSLQNSLQGYSIVLVFAHAIKSTITGKIATLFVDS